MTKTYSLKNVGSFSDLEKVFIKDELQLTSMEVSVNYEDKCIAVVYFPQDFEKEVYASAKAENNKPTNHRIHKQKLFAILNYKCLLPFISV